MSYVLAIRVKVEDHLLRLAPQEEAGDVAPAILALVYLDEALEVAYLINDVEIRWLV